MLYQSNYISNMTSLQTLRCLISQRLCVAAEEIFVMVERILTDYEELRLCSKQQHTELQATQPHTADLTSPLCKEVVYSEQQERRPSLVQEEPEPAHFKEEELLQQPKEADWSSLTLPVKREDDGENRETEPLASTSTEHMKTQAHNFYSHCSESDITEDSDEWGEPTEDQSALNTPKSQMEGHILPASTSTEHMKTHCSESDITEDSDEWGEPTEDQSALNTPKSQMEGQRLPFGNSHTRTHTAEKPFNCAGGNRVRCTVCNKSFSCDHNLKTHMRIHTGAKPFTCRVCERSFSQNCNLKKHMRTHTGEKPYHCTVCGKTFRESHHLKGHMLTHTGGKRT